MTHFYVAQNRCIYLRFRDRLFGVLVVEHAVGGRDHVPGGHQGAATELGASGVHQSHHPGIFVLLQTKRNQSEMRSL